MANVGSKVLGSGQPDRFVMFAFQPVLAVFGPKATADDFVASIR